MISMILKWLKKRESDTKPAVDAHFPIKVLIEPDEHNDGIVNTGNPPVNHVFRQESVPSEPAGRTGSTDPSEHSRCGFTTCNPRETPENEIDRTGLQNESPIDALLSTERLHAENLEEYPKIIEKQTAPRTERGPRRSRELFEEPRAAEKCNNFTLWGNRLPD